MKPALKAIHKKAETNAIASSCCGFLGEVTLTDSAVIILLTTLLGAGDMFSIITTSLLPLFYGIMVLPMAFVATRVGVRKLILISCSLSAVFYFCAASAPFCGELSKTILLGSIIAFSLSLTGFIAGWFPLADTFLAEHRRIPFFSKMRFCHQTAAVLFLFIAGAFIGAESPIWKLQAVLFVAATLYLGRTLFIARIPVFPTSEPSRVNFRQSLGQATGNKPLVGFSLYIFVLNLAAYGTLPLTFLYLKKSLQAPDNIVVIISAMGLVGMMLGYLSVGKLIRRLGVKYGLLLFHLVFAVVNLSLFFISEGSTAVFILIAGLLMLYNVMIAAASVVTASEMMALARGGQRPISMAFFSTFYFGGFGFSRLLTSLMLGTGVLAETWQLGSLTFCRYQSLFLLFTLFILLAAVFLLVVPAVFPISTLEEA